MTHISLQGISGAGISCTSRSLLINGKCISLGENSKLIFECLILIKGMVNQNKKKNIPIKVANLSAIGWFLGYDGEIIGPVSKENIQEKLKTGVYNINKLQVWNKRMSEWKFIEELSEDFILPNESSSNQEVYNESERRLNERIDVNSCSYKELLYISGITKEKVDKFIEKRDKGYYLKDIYAFQAEFNMIPHELEKIKNRLIFKQQKYDSARRVDL